MTLEQLKALLEGGQITQEQYDDMVEKLGLKEEPPADPPKDDQEALRKLIQAEVDRATNKLGNTNKQLREELEKLRKEKLTAEELAKLEAEERDKNLADREAAVKAAENKVYAMAAIKKAGLDDGSEAALEILALVNATEQADIDTNVKALKALVDKLVKAQVDATFKNNGRNPNKGGGEPTVDNPYAAATYNLTKQMELEATNPELAKQLKAAAGAK